MKRGSCSRCICCFLVRLFYLLRNSRTKFLSQCYKRPIINLQCKTPKFNTVPRKVSLVSARDSAYVVCTRERLPRKVSYFRPEKATKSAKIALSHRATYVVSLLSKKHYLPWKILTFKMIQLPKKKINWKINRELLSVITLLINVRDLFFDLKVFAAVESFWKKPKKMLS